MYTNEHIKLLNKHGALTSSLLAMKDKCNFDYARLIMQEIVNDYENVKFRTEDQIYIEGREREEWLPKEKKKRKYIKKPSKWKDITKLLIIRP
jgi:hypothetical protein